MEKRNILNSIKNDLYYKYYDMDDSFVLIDFFYKIKDNKTIYSFREIQKGKNFYFNLEVNDSSEIDFMVEVTDYINNLYDTFESFDFENIIRKSISYIKEHIPDGKIIFADFVFLDFIDYKLDYANFGTSRAFVEFFNGDIKELSVQNEHITSLTNDFKIESIDISGFVKILFCNRNFREYYDEDILKNFQQTFMKNSFIDAFHGIKTIEQNSSFFYITYIKKVKEVQKKFECSFENIDKASQWFEQQLNLRGLNKHKAEIVFNELFLNSYEHGNLGITSAQKERYLEEDIYFDKIQQLDKKCNKSTTVTLYDIKYKDMKFLLIQIEDEGIGFSTDVLFDIFKHKKILSGRGIFLCRKNSYGIHFNKKANTVMFLEKL